MFERIKYLIYVARVRRRARLTGAAWTSTTLATAWTTTTTTS